jgi:hypothetical protein
MELNNKLRPVLDKIDFVNRYRSLSNKFRFESPYFSNYSNEKVIEIMNNLGYKAKYMKSENFFKIQESEIDFQFQFNISIKNGIVELIWDVLKSKQRLQIGGPWGMITQLFNLNYDERIKLPVFRNYEDLEEILKEAFSIYEDFKAELIKLEN